MTCYKPLTAYRTPSGGITFNEYAGYKDIPLKLPCGRCTGCRLERSRQWAVRCMHEMQMHDQNTFITLTYNDENLPSPPSLNVNHYQLFMKRLRKNSGKKIRFYHCGEYGENLSRPHYHSILFGHEFNDKKYYRTVGENRLYTSETLEKLWGHGFCVIGDACFDTAAYVARYILKKQTGPKSDTHYQYIDPITGKSHALKPEYTTMSRRPGIGKTWIDKYSTDVFPADFVITNGHPSKPPKFYDDQFSKIHPEGFEDIKLRRIRRAQKPTVKCHSTSERLAVRETVKQAQLQHHKRNFER